METNEKKAVEMARSVDGFGGSKTVRTKRWIAVFALLLVSVIALSAGAMTTANAKIVNGHTSENIRTVQQKLSNWGYYSGRVDGIWGPKTRDAVKSFQRKNGLIADGIVGAKTEAALGVNFKKKASSASSISNSDLNLLARCVYGEARGEPYTGQVAVAAVILNRVRSSKFPNTIAGVIYQPLAFTAVADGQINYTPNQTAINAARDALNGVDPTNGCLFYYNPAIATSKWIWSLKVEMKIGRHSFARGQ